MESETRPHRVEQRSRSVTRLLLAYGEGDRDAFDRLIPLVYGELQRIARHQLTPRRPGDTLGPAGLVHETYLKLVDQQRADWRDRRHFYAVAARAMRQILVDHARRKRADKRGGGAATVVLDDARDVASEPEARLLDLHQALERLEEVGPRLPRVVECLYFAGLTQRETADALGVSPRTVWNDWHVARLWLREQLGGTTL